MSDGPQLRLNLQTSYELSSSLEEMPLIFLHGVPVAAVIVPLRINGKCRCFVFLVS